MCADEIKTIGGSRIEVLNRAVKFDGSRYTLYAANLLLRTALRIIVPISETTIRNEQHLYNDVFEIKWENYFDVQQTFAVYATVSSEVFRHSKYVALKAKDAIVDRFRKISGKRPDINVEEPALLINIHIRDNILTVSLDSSGASLHKRGYKVKTAPAPLNEVMAAGLIKLSQWDEISPFFDPMCGSGTILCEAMMITKGIPPQDINRSFGFKNWKDFDTKIWNMVQEKEVIKLNAGNAPIYGSDLSPHAVNATIANMDNIFPHEDHDIKVKDFFRSDPPCESGTIITNPPYDKRLKEEDIIDFYQKIGDKLKTSFPGWQAYIFSGNIEALKLLGLKPSRKYSLMNGAIPAKFYMFDIYAGSKSKS